MYLKHEPTHELIEVVNLPDVINPNSKTIRARAHSGDLIQRPMDYLKSEIVFPSGERLPQCWVDAHYYEKAA